MSDPNTGSLDDFRDTVIYDEEEPKTKLKLSNNICNVPCDKEK